MNAAAHTDDDVSDEQRRTRRLRFELIFASLWLAFGLFLLPALIFWVGGALMGPYGENAGLSTFYVDFFGDLADGSGRAWSIALGPVLLIYLLRAVFIGVKADEVEREPLDEDEPPPPRRAPVKKEAKRPAGRPARVEPRMGND
ncbi:hypothetical protein GCM10011487_45620 [Steroidobacter agaridevorans]|uniref:Uncharacterized protein n=1 Tax=Steroidobacter agaridevorans TaxID=2695856 RepID=A0A829YIA3_9GAMM|nr:hypothetical protein [Steroidobacter agaridevorans]GFE82562.1 hypothetical protein GCM10011487_45620 [Steroidobacter agaridevorans]GFE85121.1 hypothetical protein GCM10011488_00750 [Steroidobacter agaridevorans]